MNADEISQKGGAPDRKVPMETKIIRVSFAPLRLCVEGLLSCLRLSACICG
jgi:hypothetical protein